MFDQAFHPAEAGGAGEDFHLVRQSERRGAIALQFEGEHSSERNHLPPRERVLRMGEEPGIMHSGDARMSFKKNGDASCILAVSPHPAGKSLHSAVDQPAVEWRRHGSANRLHLADALEEFALGAGDDGAAEDIAMAAEIFRRRMHDEIDAEIEWSLN